MTGGRETPEVTVVVPTKNRWEILRGTIEMALAQDRVDVEVVVVDDGSTDGTAAGLRGWPDARVRHVVHERAVGQARARNDGIAAARAPWVAFLDDDDHWDRRKLALQLARARETGADVVYAGAALVDARLEPIWLCPLPEPAALVRELLRKNVVPAGSSNVLVRTELVRSLGGFDASFESLADWDLWLRLALHGRVAACPEVLVGYRMHPGNLSGNRRAHLVLAELRRLAEKHADLLRDHGTEFSTREVKVWLRKEHLRCTRAVAADLRRDGKRLRAARLYLGAGITHRHPQNVLRGLALLGGERLVRLGSRLTRSGAAEARGTAD